VAWLGDLPAHWAVFSLKRTVEGCKNGIWGNESDGENDIAVIRVADFNRNSLRVDLEKLTYRSISSKEYEPRALLSGDLLIEKSGGGEKTLVGCVVLFSHNFTAVTSNFVSRMRPLENFDSNFLCFCFNTLYQGRVNYPAIKQTTGIQNLDSEVYLQEQFCFPPPLEQTQIARFLDHETAKIDALIEQQQRLIELLKEKRQAVISHAVTKGLDPTVPMKDSGVEWLGEVPAHWSVLPFKYVTILNPPKSEFAGDKSTVCSFLPMEKLKTDQIRLDEIRPIEDVYDGYTYFREGDVLFSKVTPCFENRNTAVASSLVNGIGFGSSEINVLRPTGVSGRFLFYRILEDMLVNYWASEMTGAGGLKRVPTSVVQNFILAIPGDDEQRNIATYLDGKVDQFDKMIAEANGAVELLREHRSALISSAVTGKIDVRNWKPPASVSEQESQQEVAHG
tara:strand:- start:15 stop:1364 length:1350 start_codon:yes stop_codon:yes gene_type:complete